MGLKKLSKKKQKEIAEHLVNIRKEAVKDSSYMHAHVHLDTALIDMAKYLGGAELGIMVCDGIRVYLDSLHFDEDTGGLING